MKLDELSNIEDTHILNFLCANCDNPNCQLGRLFIPEDSLEGCSRRVSEEEFSRYVHYMTEVIPFWHQYSLQFVNDSYKEVYNFLLELYQYPIIHLLDSKGKVKNA